MRGSLPNTYHSLVALPGKLLRLSSMSISALNLRAITRWCPDGVHLIVCPTTCFKYRACPQTLPTASPGHRVGAHRFSALRFCHSFHGEVLLEPGATGRRVKGAAGKHARLAYVMFQGT